MGIKITITVDLQADQIANEYLWNIEDAVNESCHEQGFEIENEAMARVT